VLLTSPGEALLGQGEATVKGERTAGSSFGATGGGFFFVTFFFLDWVCA
jgi:hypothetical protein